MGLESLITEVIKISQEPRYSRLRDKPKDIRVMVGLGRPFMQKIFGFSLVDYFYDAEVNLESQLKWKIFLHNEIPDDCVIDGAIGIDFGTTLEVSMFGVKPIFNQENDPWYGEPVIQKEEDLDKLKYPDFYKSGLMPQLHKLYTELQKMVGRKLKVTFPGWARGPWSIACMLRGFTNLYMDLIDRPNFVHRLMQFITESRMRWEGERSRFLNIDLRKQDYFWKYVYVDYRPAATSDLYNDEVNGDMFSAKMYAEFVFPYEMKLAQFYGRTRYYHSCGNLTPFLDYIKQLPGLEMIHISPWTNLKVAKEKMGREVRLQKSMHPEDDILKSNEGEMRVKLKEILEEAKGTKIDICADALNYGSLEKIKFWLKVARETVAQYRGT